MNALLFRSPLVPACLCLLAIIVGNHGYAQEAKQHTTIELWPDGLPADAKPLTEKQIEEAKSKTTDERIFHVESPMLTIYEPPAEKKNGTAVVICPGGGYYMLAYKHEGIDLAKWFNEQGVTAFLLKYRVPRRQEKIHWEPMQDVQRAIRIVRSRADQYKIDSDRIGVLGFSAGGHLTVMAGTQFETQSYDPVDDADKLSCRPNFICPIYAAYLGNDYKDDVVELGDLVNVTENTPPTFMAVTADDNMRGAQAGLLLARLLQNGVKAEVHVWQEGGHGYGLYKRGKATDGWEENLKVWLELNGFLNSPTKDE
ncbi:alpha/beta hydrolase [Mariniblastus fucicola]|uniref:Acetylxylan esterase n=1 Tax=Mariniblastus fucicola TaxID=980251 RepID=A0A5B9PG92_9BACT|nr:alpha/beta hydrolase [Mariniblastus fucicola]QEG24245.1 Acetylxylan esterase precursor [Mariniblastus fucicola]